MSWIELFQAQVEVGLAFVALADDRRFAFAGLEVSVRARSSKSVVGKARRHEQEPGQEDGGKCDGVDHPVANAGDDLERRAFPGGAALASGVSAR